MFGSVFDVVCLIMHVVDCLKVVGFMGVIKYVLNKWVKLKKSDGSRNVAY